VANNPRTSRGLAIQLAGPTFDGNPGQKKKAAQWKKDRTVEARGNGTELSK